MRTFLTVRDLRVTYRRGREVFEAVRGVSFDIHERETLAIVGESGCGKTTIAKALLGLLPYEGKVESPNDLQGKILAERIGMVWQDPFATLNPLWRIKDIVAEPAKLAKRDANIVETLELVGLEERFLDRYPHEMSGGQRQRVAIARAILLRPPLLICDEPTAALDLSVQAQVLNLLKDIQQEIGCSYLYISHDLATVNHLSDRIAIMYRGEFVEHGETAQVFKHPGHPYTQLLWKSMLSHERLGVLPEAQTLEGT